MTAPPSGSLRVLVAGHWQGMGRSVLLFLVAALFLHLLEAKVGTWAAGALGPLASILVGIAAPVWVLVFFPSWFAWHVAKPLGLRPLALVACWFSPFITWRELGSIRVFLGVAANEPFPAADAMAADAWTALAAALQAERQGDVARARPILDALKCLPQESRFPWLARQQGVATLVMIAWERGDWQTVLDYAVIGRGRAIRLLGLLAQVELGHRVRPGKLWTTWALSPIRRRTLAALRSAVARQILPPKVTPAPTETPTGMPESSLSADVRLRHLSLLAAASRGEVVSTREVLALASAWQPHLDKAGLAKLSARGLELDVRDACQQSQALYTVVMGELTLLATACEGPLTTRADDCALGTEIVTSLREHLCKQVEATLSRINPETYTSDIHPLEAWERWLALRAALERLQKQADSSTVTALWNGRVSTTVWNWTCVVFNRHPRRAAWVAHMMYLWVAEQAELMGDMRTVVTNRENARIALGA